MYKFKNKQELCDKWLTLPFGTYVRLYLKDGSIEMWKGKAVRLTEKRLEIKVDDNIIIYWKKPAFYKFDYVDVVRK